MKTTQIEANDFGNRELLRFAGVKRIFPGWYTVHFRGVSLDKSTICGAKRNPKGEIKIP